MKFQRFIHTPLFQAHTPDFNLCQSFVDELPPFPSNKQNLSWATTRFSEYTHICQNHTLVYQRVYTNTYANTALVHTFHFPWLSLNSPYTNCCIHKPFQSLSSNSFISFSKFSVNSCSTSTHVKCLLTTQTNNNHNNNNNKDTTTLIHHQQHQLVATKRMYKLRFTKQKKNRIGAK